MPTVLSDPSPTVYVFLVALVVVAAGLWARRRDRRSLAGLWAAAALLGLVVLLDGMFDSPREEATRTLRAMAAAATAGDGPGFTRHMSERATIQGADRERVRSSAVWALVRRHQARVSVSGFDRDDARAAGDSEIEIGFLTRAEADGGAEERYTVAGFVRDPDGRLRVKTLRFYDPTTRRRGVEQPLPGFP